MLKTSVVLTFILSFGLLYFPIQVNALEIVVDNGKVSFYQDTVLGDRDGEEQSEVEIREEIISRQKQLVRVKSSGEKTEIELRPVPARQSTNPIPELKEKLERIEQIESDRVSLEFESKNMESTNSSPQEPVVVRSQNQG